MVHFALFLVKISINFSPSYSTASLMNLLLKVMQDGVNFAPSLPGGFHMHGKGNDPQEAFSD
jgi:hypothetical protein